MVVYNTAAFVIFGVALAVAIGVDAAMGFGETEGVPALLAGFATMTLLGVVAEHKLAIGKQPRVFWVFPIWVAGVVGIGAALLVADQPIAAYATFGAAGLGFFGLEARKPGVFWLAVVFATGGVGLIAQPLVEDWLRDERMIEGKPWWGYAIRGAAMIVVAIAGYRLRRARAAAATR